MANEKKGLVDITTGAEVADANANGILDLTSGEVSQIAAIGAETISAAQWAYLGASDQGIAQASSVQFASVNVNGAYTLPTTDGTANYVLATDGAGNVSWTLNAASTAWGDITGTVSNQTDLQTALDAKQNMAPVSAPALPNSTGTQGTWAYDSNYLYICTATDTWIRAAVVTSWS